MTKLTSELYEDLPDIITGKIYKILKAEVITTPKQGYQAVEVELEDVPTGVKHGTMLWIEEKVGQKTKAGSFILALGKDTAKWIGKTIEIVSWVDKEREVKVLR